MNKHGNKNKTKPNASGSIRALPKPPSVPSFPEPGTQPRKKQSRRKSGFNLSLWVNLIMWGCFFWIFDRILSAMPEQSTFFTRMFALDVRSSWDMARISESTTWMLVLAGVALVNMAIGVVRNKGGYRAAEIASLVLAVMSCGLALWLMKV